MPRTAPPDNPAPRSSKWPCSLPALGITGSDGVAQCGFVLGRQCWCREQTKTHGQSNGETHDKLSIVENSMMVLSDGHDRDQGERNYSSTSITSILSCPVIRATGPNSDKGDGASSDRLECASLRWPAPCLPCAECGIQWNPLATQPGLRPHMTSECPQRVGVHQTHADSRRNLLHTQHGREQHCMFGAVAR